MEWFPIEVLNIKELKNGYNKNNRNTKNRSRK